MATPTFPHCKAAEKYARDIVGGKILACKFVKAACARQLDDLERSKTDKTWPYIFNQDKAEERCRFIELMPHVKGAQWSGQHIKLEPWQAFLVCTIYGWVSRKTGLRRFRSAYVEVARKNAKTTLLAGLSLAALTIDGELGAEVYSAATTRDQAKIVFNIAKQMAQMEPAFRAQFGVQVYENSLAVDATGSKMVPLAAEGSTMDGLNTSFCCLDELHAHRTRAVHDVIDSSLGSRSQPLIFKITTAGADRAGVCFDVRLYIQKILGTTLRAHGGMGYKVEGNAAVDDTAFGIIYTLDEGEEKDPFNETNWIKANPNLGVSVELDDLRRQAQMARTQNAALGEFLTKRMNIWIGSSAGWLSMIELEACADPALNESAFYGQTAFIGLDAGFKVDLFAKVKVFTRELDDGIHYYAFARHYTHETLAEAEGNEQIAAWARQGYVHLSEGNVTDIAYVRDELIGTAADPGDLQHFAIGAVGYDPAQLTPFASEMIEQGLPMVEVRPLVLNFSGPMKEIAELIRAGRFHFNGDPCLAWCLGNVTCRVDGKDNIFPRKEREENKIDGAIALIMAMNRALLTRPDGLSYYQQLANRDRAEQPEQETESPAPIPVVSHKSYWERQALKRMAEEKAKRESAAEN